MYKSTFSGKPIRPPEGKTRTVHRSSEEERAFALELHNNGLHGEWRAIARRVTRRFGIQRTDTTVKRWIENAEAETSTEE